MTRDLRPWGVGLEVYSPGPILVPLTPPNLALFANDEHPIRILIISSSALFASIPFTKWKNSFAIVLTDSDTVAKAAREQPSCEAIVWTGLARGPLILELSNLLMRALLKLGLNPETQRGVGLALSSNGQISPNLLCRSNEVIRNYLRGYLPEYLSGGVLNTEDCVETNVRLAWDVLAEPILNNLVGLITKGVSLPQELEHLSLGVRSLADIARTRGFAYCIESDSYARVKRILVGTLGHQMTESVVLFIPSMHPDLLELLRDQATKRFGDSRQIKDKIDQALNLLSRGGRRFEFPKDAELKRILESLVSGQQSAGFYFGAIATLLGLTQVAPVLKSELLPSRFFDVLRGLRNSAENHLKILRQIGGLGSSSFTQSGSSFANQLRLASRIIGQQFPNKYTTFLLKSRPRWVTVLSDLPIELMDCGQGPLSRIVSVERIPLQDGTLLLPAYDKVHLGIPISLKVSMSEILVCCCLDPADPLYSEYKIFRNALQRSGVNPIFREIQSSEAFVREMNRCKPKILEFYGHAGYDSESRSTSVYLGEEQCEISSLLRGIETRAFPPLVILVGCETASCDAFSGTGASLFLAGGALCVVATLLPIYGDLAGYFAGRLLFNLKQHPNSRLDALIQATKNGMWPIEQIDALLRTGLASPKQYVTLWRDYIVDRGMQQLDFAEFAAYSNIKARFLGMLRERGLFDSWIKIESSIVPHSLFFTLLGFGHSLRIQLRP